ncbi:MAG: PcfJ domain-containing protein [Candidatus Limiplasma sp.]|nr:PcfJ domain-containing protein [Candidatus Limiplasma sp.]
MAAMKWDEALRHVVTLLPETVRPNALARLHHFIWITGKQGHRRGYCTACLTEIPVGEEAHKQAGTCPHCGRDIQYRWLRYARAKLTEHVFLIQYRKSLLESDALVCVGYDIAADWSQMTESSMQAGADRLPVKITPAEVCVFRYGIGGTRFQRDYYLSRSDGRDIFFQTRNCTSGYKPDSPYRIQLDLPALNEAIQGTSFARVLAVPSLQQSGVLKWYADFITLLDRLAAYPTLEYLYKMGYTALANAVVARVAGNLIKRRGTGPCDVLRLTQAQWSEVRARQLPITHTFLRMARFVQEHHLTVPMERYEAVYARISSSWCWNGTRNESAFSAITKKFPGTDMNGLLHYCDHRKIELSLYHDYLGQLQALGMDLQCDLHRYPKDFHAQHAELSQRVRIQRDEEKAAQLKAFVATLDRYCYRAHGLLLRPLADTAEVIREGTALHHCVGSYAQRYAEGKTVLCCLRRTNAPEVPLYTVEFTPAGKRVQCRGDHNQTAREDEPVLEQFWAAFERYCQKRAAKAERKTA